MIEQVDQRLLEWVKSTLDVSSVSLNAPSDGQAGRGIGLYLLEILPALPARSSTRPPLQIALRYLVTAWAEDPLEVHRLLGTLAFAALEHPDFELEPDPLPATAWEALHAVPRAHFLLRVLLRQERPEPAPRLVREPLQLQAVPATSISGVVLGPNDVPIAGAVVELPGLQLSRRADNKGRFHFAMVPAEPVVKRLRVRAKGRVLEVNVEGAPSEEAPLVINFPLE